MDYLHMSMDYLHSSNEGGYLGFRSWAYLYSIFNYRARALAHFV